MDDSLCEFYGFERPPFEPVTEAGNIFRGSSQRELAEKIVSEVLDGCDVLGVRGDHGVGKTTLMYLLAGLFQSFDIPIVQVTRQFQTQTDVHRLVEEAVGRPAGPPPRIDPGPVGPRVRRLVVIFDDAHTLSPEMFRVLWHLKDARLLGDTHLHVVLLGDLGPWPGLQHPDLERLRQATSACYILFSLKEDEAAAYLDHRLRLAGQSWRHLMTRPAMAELVDLAGGVPGQINALTERALHHGHQTGRRRITPGLVRQAVLSDAMNPAATLPGFRPRRPAATALVFVAVMIAAGAGVLWRALAAEAPAPGWTSPTGRMPITAIARPRAVPQQSGETAILPATRVSPPDARLSTPGPQAALPP